ncbi:MAG: NADH-quinone oxidoreductase subunit [Chloroflexota bacterium]|jgi:NADH-quinone oxidoreductase subunit L|nr:NADH-quinone oxidoreductase subunit [Chloroflexota bacterium]
MTAGQLVTAALLLPALGFILNRFWGRTNRRGVQVAGPASVGAAFVIFIAAAIVEGRGAETHNIYQWLVGTPALTVQQAAVAGIAVPGVGAALRLDSLAFVMTLVVTGVGFLIHVYAVGYMDEENDADYARFFAHMNLFVFSMLLLVLAANFVLLVIGWAMVGLSSYLLIGFYNQRPAAVAAARKAFVMNVIGDVGIVIASFVAFQAVGTLDIATVNGHAAGLAAGAAEAIGFFLIVGAVAKSAQIPLHTWLPDAMEGPTPVSALIHAATMVTAGVYLLARFQPVFAHAPAAAGTAAVIGVLTALMAAVIATIQTDIKRVLAYSTMSQVGYMFFAVAIGADVAGIFHLVTHAFFKALLFLAAGNVIHALHGEQDIRRMGGLWRRMPATAGLFLLGSLALAGIPPLAGFFSKDMVVGAGFFTGPWHPLGGIVLVLVTALTGYYMLRAFWIAFMAPPAEAAEDVAPDTAEDESHAAAHSPATDPHDAPMVMLAPVLALGLLAAIGGLVIQPGPWHLLSDYTSNLFAAGTGEGTAGLAITALVLGAAMAGIGVAYQRFGRAPGTIVEPAPPPVLAHAFYWDAAYERVVVRPLWRLGHYLEEAFEIPVVAGAVDAVVDLAEAMGVQVRRLQSGFLRSYAMIFAAAVLVVVVVAGVGLR